MRTKTSIRNLLSACIPAAIPTCTGDRPGRPSPARSGRPSPALSGNPAPPPEMHVHVAAIAGCLKRTAARSVTFQAGSILVEARRLAILILALTAISVRATDPVAHLQTDPVAHLQTDPVAPLPEPDITKSGSFLTCPRTGSDLIIDFGVRATDPVAPVQTHGRASLQNNCSATLTVKSGPTGTDRQLWDIPEANGIILNWDCSANRLYVTDPAGYLTGHALWYTIKIWRSK